MSPAAAAKLLATLSVAALSLPVQAEVKAKDAWVRATVPAQKSTGAFMTLVSSEDARIVAASSPAAKAVELHETTSRDGVMHMQALATLELPAGKAVELRPGGRHVMLLGLAKPVAAGERVPIVFTVEHRDGRRTSVEVRAEARPIGSR